MLFLPVVRSLVLGMVGVTVVSFSVAAPIPVETEEKKDARLSMYMDRNAHCTNGTVLRLKVLDENLTLHTPYGKLEIPLADVREIEFATRTSESVLKRIDDSLKGLRSDEAKVRAAAVASLARLKEKAYHALLKFEDDKDAEVKRQVGKLLEEVRKEFNEEQLVYRKADVIHTANSKIAGEIKEKTFTVHTDQFGESKLALMLVRDLRNVDRDDGGAGNVLPDPGHLYAFRGQSGKSLKIRLVGTVDGSVWGTDKYTLDSKLSSAAVHAGVLKLGETKVVTVKLLPPTRGFVGSLRHGIQTRNYAEYPGAFEFAKKGR